MSVNSYLTSLASALVLKDTEKESINTSISTLKSRLSAFFGSNITNQFIFGSYTRYTILPRNADENSDIDYMIVFNISSGTYKPQTYLNNLRQFAERYYPSSEIHQSHPTVTLELNHIKFELVPAVYNYRYQIPSPAISWNEWMDTDPNSFNQLLTNINTTYNFQIKPLVRLIKYWNAHNGHIYQSFELEKFIVGLSFWSSSCLKDLFYYFWNTISWQIDTPQDIKTKVHQAKERVSLIRQYEQQGQEGYAEYELQKLLPSIF